MTEDSIPGGMRADAQHRTVRFPKSAAKLENNEWAEAAFVLFSIRCFL